MSLNVETWEVVPNTNGKVFVSNTGKVKSFLRNERVLKTQTDGKGYRRVSITINGKKTTHKLHRLVAEAFIPNPLMLPQVNHKDCDKNNNNVNNLEWCTNKENAIHAIQNGLWVNVFAGATKSNNERKVPIISVDQNGKEIFFESISEAERYYKTRHISDVLKGKRATASGCRFYKAR